MRAPEAQIPGAAPTAHGANSLRRGAADRRGFAFALCGLVAIGWPVGATPATPATPTTPVRRSVELAQLRASAPPQVQLGELFAAVQSARLFADQKTFADAVPMQPPGEILRDYRRQRPAGPEALRGFVSAHFQLPGQVQAPLALAPSMPLLEHIDRLWPLLTRSTPEVARYGSALALPAPYVVPGGRFREIYYWDSYFTMLGLADSGRRDLIESMLSDFSYLIDTVSHVPNGTRSYYLSRSQPPFFFEMVALSAPEDPAAAFARFLPQLEREYAFWMQGAAHLHPGEAHRRVVALAGGALLNRYWDDLDLPRDESYAEDGPAAEASIRRRTVSAGPTVSCAGSPRSILATWLRPACPVLEALSSRARRLRASLRAGRPESINT